MNFWGKHSFSPLPANFHDLPGSCLWFLVSTTYENSEGHQFDEAEIHANVARQKKAFTKSGACAIGRNVGVSTYLSINIRVVREETGALKVMFTCNKSKSYKSNHSFVSWAYLLTHAYTHAHRHRLSFYGPCHAALVFISCLPSLLFLVCPQSSTPCPDNHFWYRCFCMFLHIPACSFTFLHAKK